MYSVNYAGACNEFVGPISTSLHLRATQQFLKTCRKGIHRSLAKGLAVTETIVFPSNPVLLHNYFIVMQASLAFMGFAHSLPPRKLVSMAVKNTYGLHGHEASAFEINFLPLLTYTLLSKPNPEQLNTKFLILLSFVTLVCCRINIGDLLNKIMISAQAMVTRLQQ